jgi:hypothetical protein
MDGTDAFYPHSLNAKAVRLRVQTVGVVKIADFGARPRAR